MTVPSTALPPPGPGSRRSRFAERLLPGGTEPDPRFTLANERTFLAWIRTSLALLAGGIAVEAFTTDVFPEPIRRGLSVLLLLLLCSTSWPQERYWAPSASKTPPEPDPGRPSRPCRTVASRWP